MSPHSSEGPVNSPPLTRPTVEDAAGLVSSLSDPSEALVKTMSQLEGDIIILGAGGKIGPTLSRMARRAIDVSGVKRRVIAVSRFSNDSEVASLQSDGIEVLRGDLLDNDFVRSLPRVASVLYLVGMKFGGPAALAETWTSNVYVAGDVADHFRDSRIAAMSTGNVYGMVAVDPGTGAAESDAPDPRGEYAMSALGRERVFQYFSQRYNTPLSIIRLNYATEFRYGILVDLAKQVYRGETVSLDMGYFNVIWQRDACDIILRSLAFTAVPPRIINVTGAERVSCRQVCEQFGELFGRKVHFDGMESPTALLSDARQAIQLFGRPTVTLDAMLTMTADWFNRGGETWNKPTHFQVRDGKF
ncbi:MAG: NAD-dependent epimerase/dehydratase family protein [Planctomycetes bacterium]|nr:NAD-dependent epimerase/dehydratase family protein [Planctomycetota bacterium]